MHRTIGTAVNHSVDAKVIPSVVEGSPDRFFRRCLLYRHHRNPQDPSTDPAFLPHQTRPSDRFHPNRRAGSSSTARTSARSASNVMPTSRNGSAKSQTTGKRISARSAAGQESTNRMHQPTKRIRVFTSLSFHHAAPRQLRDWRGIRSDAADQAHSRAHLGNDGKTWEEIMSAGFPGWFSPP
jgi:hypothetical protein